MPVENLNTQRISTKSPAPEIVDMVLKDVASNIEKAQRISTNISSQEVFETVISNVASVNADMANSNVTKIADKYLHLQVSSNAEIGVPIRVASSVIKSKSRINPAHINMVKMAKKNVKDLLTSKSSIVNPLPTSIIQKRNLRSNDSLSTATGPSSKRLKS